MKKIKLTQGQVTLVDDIDYEYLSQWKWYANWDHNCFRAKRNLPIDGKRKALFIYTVIAERMGIDNTQIDHKDRNPLNNCRYNLRPATASQNGHNRGVQSDSTTGVKGVSFHKRAGKYTTRIKLHGKQHHLGYFDTLDEAKKVVRKKREELAGEFACHGEKQ
jgi:hypothetical protein